MRINKAAEQLNVTPQTVKNYVKQGKLKSNLTPGGQHTFTQEQINDFLGITNHKRKVFYCRDSGGDKGLLKSQTLKLEQAYGKPSKIYKDGASGLNENRKGLKNLINDAKMGMFNTVCITAKDRLTRFGYSYLEDYLNFLGVNIVILDDQKNKSPHEELLQDFMSLIASFSGKYYKIRSLEHRKMLLEIAEKKMKNG